MYAMAIPSALSWRIIPKSLATSALDKAEVGSSITMTFGWPPSTLAISTSWASCWLISEMGLLISRYSRPTRESRALDSFSAAFQSISGTPRLRGSRPASRFSAMLMGRARLNS